MIHPQLYNLKINIMITKKRGIEIKRLEQELNNLAVLPAKRQNLFERSKNLKRQPNPQPHENTMRTTRKYFSTDKCDKTSYNQTPKNDEALRTHHKSLYNRPFHLLRQYLNRKERLSFMPLLDSNPQKVEDISKAYTTLNEFRIKKSKKIFFLTPENQQKNDAPSHNKINKIDQDFINFNASKNLYQMTHEELQESIKWKKHFLDILNEKIRDSRNSSFRERSFK